MSEVTEMPSVKETLDLPKEKQAAAVGRYETFVVKLSQAFAWVSGAAVVAMMLLIVGNGIIRIFSKPILGTNEIVGWLAALSVSFALGYTQLHKGHVDIDLLVTKFPHRLQKLLRIMVAFLSLVFFSIVGWQLFQYAMNLATNQNVSQTLGIIYYPFVILSSLGFAVFVLVLLNDLIAEIKGGH